MSEFNKLKDEGEQYAKDHPEQVHGAEQKAEHAVESKFGIGGQQDQGQQDQDQQDQDQQGAGQQNQDQQNQDQQGQGQQDQGQ
jgi:hypothetical protein